GEGRRKARQRRDRGQALRREARLQIAHVEAREADRPERAKRLRRNLLRALSARDEVTLELRGGDRDVARERSERSRISAPVEESAREDRKVEPASSGLVEERLDRTDVVVRDDLCQREVETLGLAEQELDLLARIAIGIGPAAEKAPRVRLSQPRAKLPGVRQAARDPVVAITAENDEPRKARAARALGEPETVIERVLEGEERHDPLADGVPAEVGDE